METVLKREKLNCYKYKNAMSEVKNSFDRLMSIVDTHTHKGVWGKTGESECKSIEIIHIKPKVKDTRERPTATNSMKQSNNGEWPSVLLVSSSFVLSLICAIYRIQDSDSRAKLFPRLVSQREARANCPSEHYDIRSQHRVGASSYMVKFYC